MTATAETRTAGQIAAPPNLSDHVWNYSPTMRRICDHARTQGDSPDALLGLLLARFGTLLGPEWRTPSFTPGRSGSLNLNVAIVGHAGSGKTTANDTARRIIPGPDDPQARFDVPIGTGEGLVEAYFTRKTMKDDDGKKTSIKTQTRNRILFVLDEGEDMKSEAARTGSKLLSTLRGAWSGSVLGQANASEETVRQLRPHSYRMNTVVNVQPSVASFILDGHDVGTPQRFLFLSAYDIHADDYDIVEELSLEPSPNLGDVDGIIRNPLEAYQRPTLDQRIADELYARQKKKRRYEVLDDPQEAHRDIAQMKLATYLTLIHKRGRITPDDWWIAGLIFDTSQAVVRWLFDLATLEREISALANDQRIALREHRVDDYREHKTTQRLAATIARKVHRHGADGTPEKDAEQALAGRDRALAESLDIIDHAIERRWIVRRIVNGEPQLFAGPEKPPASSRVRK